MAPSNNNDCSATTTKNKCPDEKVRKTNSQLWTTLIDSFVNDAVKQWKSKKSPIRSTMNRSNFDMVTKHKRTLADAVILDNFRSTINNGPIYPQGLIYYETYAHWRTTSHTGYSPECDCCTVKQTVNSIGFKHTRTHIHIVVIASVEPIEPVVVTVEWLEPLDDGWNLIMWLCPKELTPFK